MRPASTSRCSQSASATSLRVATFNIHAGRDARLEDVAEVLAALDADVIALQEVERHPVANASDLRPDQARFLADRLGMNVAFAAARVAGDGELGVALLSRLPFTRVDRVDLSTGAPFSPRTAIDAEVCAGARPLRVLATHNDLTPWAANSHAGALLARARSSLGDGTIVLGDFNVLPSSDVVRTLERGGLTDVLARLGPVSTFRGDPIARRLDYIFVDQALAARVSDLKVKSAAVSDHLPALAELDLTGDDVETPRLQVAAGASRSRSLRLSP